MRRQDNTRKRLHPNRLLLAMAALVMLPGIAAAQSIDAYGETTGSLESVDTCWGLDEQHDLPDLPDSHVDAYAEGAINDVARASGSATGSVDTPEIPDAGIDLDAQADTDYADMGLGASADQDGIHADACADVDTPELPEPRLSIGAQVEGHFQEIRAQVESSVNGTFSAVSDFFMDAYLSLQAQVQVHF